MLDQQTITDLYEDTGVLYVDNSILTCLAECETKATMQYGYHLRSIHDDVSAMRAGTAVHKALEAHFCGSTVDEAMEVLFQDYYEYAISNVDDKSRLAYSNVCEIVKSWIWHHPLHKLPFVPMRLDRDRLMVEQKFCLPLTSDGKIMFVGAIDLVGTRRDGKGVILIDTKTSGRVDALFKRQFELGSQMTGYAWALMRMLGRPITSIYINVVEMKVVPNDKKRKCSSHRCPYADCGFLHMKHELAGPYGRAPHIIQTWYKNAVRFATRWRDILDKSLGDIHNIKRVPQDGMFKYQVCARCSLSDFCRGGRNVDNPDSLFYYEPWYPGPTKEIIDARQS